MSENNTTELQEKDDSEVVFDMLLSDKSPLTAKNPESNLASNSSSDEENRTPVKTVRRRTKRFSDSDSEAEGNKENVSKEHTALEHDSSEPNVSSESEQEVIPRKSRLRANSDSSNDSDGSPKEGRIGSKRNKLHEKFKGLLNSRSKEPVKQKDENLDKLSEDNGNSSSDDSGSGIESIKQKIKHKSMLLKPSICDPDTSSDEENSQQQNEQKKKQKQRSTIMISPKPARMSAKQAMENMQKIKSESNRMLREKEVSLPYHRPKALSLKDIMSRRKPALSADGKALPLKMNSDQLKQYVKLLEQRNKEMMELCKSDTDEEDPEKADEPNPHDVKHCEETADTNVIEQQECEDSSLPVVNMTEQTNEDELPDLTVEVVQKEHNDSNTDMSEQNDVEKTNNKDLTMEIVEKEQSNSNAVITEQNETEKFTEDESPHQIVESIQKEQNSSKTDSNEDDKIDLNSILEVNIASTSKNADKNDSQLMELHYDTDKLENTEKFENTRTLADIPNENESTVNRDLSSLEKEETISNNTANDTENEEDEPRKLNDSFSDDFSDVDINMEDLETIIENANNTVNTDETVNSPMLIKDAHTLNMKPKITGTPGMVIDLDGSNPMGSRKLTGVELLKERFTYFAKLKTPEEKERERELKIKPGMQHLKLKQELEEKISEQRSLEWAKRLEDVKQQQMELDAVRGEESDGDDIEKIEAKLDEKDVENETSSESEEEEEVACDLKDKPRNRNPMIDDEAEVSGDDETEERDEEAVKSDQGNEPDCDNDNEDSGDDNEESDESSDESSEDEHENQSKSKPKKGRILKAFEDSDDETTAIEDKTENGTAQNTEINNETDQNNVIESQTDDVIPLAQTNKSISEDIFASQGSSIVLPSPLPKTNESKNKLAETDNSDLGTQTFSILGPNTSELNDTENILNIPDKLDIICDTQPNDNANLDDVIGMCSGKFTQTQNVIPAEIPTTQSQSQYSQGALGEDILELCTGKFYDNQFVSQADGESNATAKSNIEPEPSKKIEEEKDLLDSILKEMDEPGNNETSGKKYVFDNANENEAVAFDSVNQVRKKFVIESDDESPGDAAKIGKKKKFKKRKLEKRALHISDDEEEEEQSGSDEELIDYMSDAEEGDAERIVEYDSEENEVEVRPQNQKKKRKMAEFFEQEAELTSEDEWVGSGDEDEAGLDRMEREAGDDDKFHEGQLQRELGQIHMRDVLDQDKREVRLIQELLFEDGDLGDGHRQRKFRWKNLDGDDEEGAMPNIFGESQDEEFESEEQWRKQRHEREVYLRSLQNENNETEDHNISIDRTSIIKANLCSKTMSSLLLEVNETKIEESPVAVEKKPSKEESGPPMPLPIMQQNYHGSFLTRGRGALARLAALAMPLAGEADDDKVGSIGPSSKRNFVFTTVSPADKGPKVAKRKAADNVNDGTPRLMKKLKTEHNKKIFRNSLLDHLKAL